MHQYNFGKTKRTKTVKKEKTAEEIKAQKELDKLVAAATTDRKIAPVAAEEYTKPVTYVTASNGLFKVRKTDIALYIEEVESFQSEIPGIDKMEAGVQLLIPKIPASVMIELLSYYRAVNRRDKTECSVLLFWNTNNIEIPDIPGVKTYSGEFEKLVAYCPVQTNSAALSDFTEDIEQVDWFRTNMAPVCESHSHNTMQAFFSGTDDANENSNQFFFVWGKVEDEEPMYAFRYVVGDTKQECSPSLLFDWPKLKTTVKTSNCTTTIYQLEGVDPSFADNSILSPAPVETNDIKTFEEEYVGPFKEIDFPSDWMTQHKVRPHVHSTYYGYGKRNRNIQTANNSFQSHINDYADDFGFPYNYGLTKQGDFLDDEYDILDEIDSFKNSKNNIIAFARDKELSSIQKTAVKEMLSELKQSLVDEPGNDALAELIEHNEEREEYYD